MERERLKRHSLDPTKHSALQLFFRKEEKEEIFIQLVLDVIRYFLGEIPKVLSSPQIKKTYWKIYVGFAS